MQKYKDLVKIIKSKPAPDRLAALLNFGTENTNENPDEALLALEEAGKIALEIDKKKKYVKSQILKIDCYFQKEDFEQADKIFHEMLSFVWERSVDVTDWMLCNQHAYRYYLYGNYNKALIFFQKSLAITKKIKDQKHSAGVHCNISSVYTRMGNLPSALESIKESITLEKEGNNLFGLSRSYNQLAGIYLKSGKTKEALENYLSALHILEKPEIPQNDQTKSSISVITNNIANIYSKINENEKALENYLRSMELKTELGLEDRIAITLNNIGNTCKKLQKYEEAMNYLEQALVLAKKHSSRTDEALTQQNIGLLYHEMDNLEEALKYFRESEKMRREINDPHSLCCILLNIGNVLTKIKSFQEAETILLEGMLLAQEHHFSELELETYTFLIELYDDLNDPKTANLFRSKFITLNKTITYENYNNELAEMKTKYETDLREKEAELLKQKNVELEEKNDLITKQKMKLEKTLEELHRSEISYNYAASELKHNIGSNIIGESPQLKKIINLISKVANTTNTSVLITGESGTGKELIARAIHEHSKRSYNNFCAVNVSSIPASLFESEFFGHKKSSFTGADRDKPGWFEIADNGTIFLDEIGTLSPDLQIKLLRVLEERKIIRIGSHHEIPVDIRIISATNSNLLNLVEQENFRSDLYHRLATFVINIPPLRERINDIPLLLEHFVKHFGTKMNKQINKMERKVETELLSYEFPGNVRELRNLVERAIIMCNSSTLKLTHFSIPSANANRSTDCDKIIPLEKLEKDMVLKALKATGFHQAKAAKLLGIKPKAIERRMIKYGIKK